jgi:integrase
MGVFSILSKLPRQKPATTGELLNEKEAAARLAVSVQTLARIRKREEIGFAKISGRFYYYRLDMDEMRRFLTKAQEAPHIFTYCMIALNTLARPDAVMDLAPAQVNLQDRRINLNPKGRKQTKKYRPIVPITDTLLPFVQARDVERFVMWQGRPIESVKTTFRRIVRDAGLSKEITPYSLRHTMAAELRRRSVPAWEVEGLLGHRRPGVTETYAEFDPAYLSKGREAIDAYFADLGLIYVVPNPNCVSVACHPKDDGLADDGEVPVISGGLMVGATGIEPVTPTMST